MHYATLQLTAGSTSFARATVNKTAEKAWNNFKEKMNNKRQGEREERKWHNYCPKTRCISVSPYNERPKDRIRLLTLLGAMLKTFEPRVD